MEGPEAHKAHNFNINVVSARVESGCIGLEILGPPHQTKKIFGRSAGVWLKFG